MVNYRSASPLILPGTRLTDFRGVPPSPQYLVNGWTNVKLMNMEKGNDGILEKWNYGLMDSWFVELVD